MRFAQADASIAHAHQDRAAGIHHLYLSPGHKAKLLQALAHFFATIQAHNACPYAGLQLSQADLYVL